MEYLKGSQQKASVFYLLLEETKAEPTSVPLLMYITHHKPPKNFHQTPERERECYGEEELVFEEGGDQQGSAMAMEDFNLFFQVETP